MINPGMMMKLLSVVILLCPSSLWLLVVEATKTTSSAAVAHQMKDLGKEEDDDDPAQALVDQMTLDEKISMVHGTRGPYVGNIPGIPRLKIPPLLMNDGPQGFRPDKKFWGTSTAWPCALNMAATWDPLLTNQWGKAMAKEFLQKGSNMLLGPAVNVARIPQNGRNFEYLSGEDPILGSILVTAEIRGIQSQGVIANIKHYVFNNQETNRTTVNSIVDERTQWEIYMPPFAAAVTDGNVLSFMCSYNVINGHHACENFDTLTQDLKQRLPFKGFVVSDWGATHSTIDSVNAGLDMEMPGRQYYGDTLKEAIESNKLSESKLDEMVHRVLYAMITSGVMNRTDTNTGSITANVTSDEHNQLARDFAAAGVILLKNDNHVLPLSPCKGNHKSNIDDSKSILVMGDIMPTGDGSGWVPPPYTISALDGIKTYCGDDNVYYSSMDNPDYTKVNQVDHVIIFTSTRSGEGHDRKNLSFPTNELDVIDKVISMVSSPNKVIVVGTAPGAVLVPFVDDVSAMLLSFMPGQEGGNAIADVLFGRVNPSGKLPVTLPNKENEMNMTPQQYPGIDNTAIYSEKLLIGYRWYDANNVKPKFAFGFGLSYTTFAFTDLKMDDESPNSFKLTNTGTVDGYETCQIYVAFPKEVGEPPKVLKGFLKVYLKAGESERVHFELTSKELSIWDVDSHKWEPVKGTIDVLIGPSSDNLPLQGSIHNAANAAAAAAIA